MLKDEEFKELVESLKLDPLGRDFISNIRASPPARLVSGAGKHNLCGQIFSQKMGCLIQYESRTGEALFALNAEYDDEVLEFYDQPVTITVSITDKRGRRNRTTYTPDYVVLRRTGVTFFEIKPCKELKKRVSQRPIDWSEEDGRFRYAPAEAAFRELGFDYQIVASEDLSQRRAHNIRLLLNARRIALSDNDLKSLDKLVAHVQKYGPLPMDRALAAMDLRAATVAIVGIDRKLFVADIDRSLLSRPNTVWLAADKEHLSSIAALTTGRLGEELPIGAILQTNFPRPGEHYRIIERLAIIKGDKEPNVHPSTVRRWKACLAKADNNPTALASHYAKCGTRGPRVHPDHGNPPAG